MLQLYYLYYSFSHNNNSPAPVPTHYRECCRIDAGTVWHWHCGTATATTATATAAAAPTAATATVLLLPSDAPNSYLLDTAHEKRSEKKRKPEHLDHKTILKRGQTFLFPI